MYYIQLMCSLIHYGVKYYVREALSNEKTICYIYNNYNTLTIHFLVFMYLVILERVLLRSTTEAEEGYKKPCVTIQNQCFLPRLF